MEIVFTEEERQSMIFLMAFSQIEELSIFHFQEFLQVSKNTILKDIKNLRIYLEKKEVYFEYSRRKGFYLSGDENILRSLAIDFIGKLIVNSNGRRLLYEGLLTHSTDFYNEVREGFLKTIKDLELMIVPSRFDELAYFLSYLLCRTKFHQGYVDEGEKIFLQSLIAYKLSRNFLEEFSFIKNSDEEAYYFSILFMTVLQGEVRDRGLEFLLECSSDIIHNFEQIAAIEFKEYRKLLMNIFHHLVPAYFRIKYNFILSNIIIHEIKEQYHEIFEFTKISLRPLESLLESSIPEEEIGYFTILFGGELNKQRNPKQERAFKALILCPSGISTSLIMKTELEELFPQLEFYEASSIDKLNDKEFDNDYDLIFSSVDVKSDKKVYVINPLMSRIEKNYF